MSATERSPLLRDNNETTSAEDAAYAAAAESAIASAFGDPNASAFAVVPPGPDRVDEESPAPAPEQPEFNRADVFVILSGLWVGTFLAALGSSLLTQNKVDLVS